MRPIHFAFAAAMALASGQAAAQAYDPVARGGELYRSACASCHGVDGKGGGPVARYLETKPSDLTTMTRRNNGTFPFYRAFQVIDGREEVAQHGPRDMLIWGNMLRFEAGDQYGSLMRETYVRGRIYELVSYLDSIQQR
ncbi:cytochrome c [Elioraea rosea]|uniref:cytochrome c n=1 Tax=Elioraea rosea TaxID=2492390 RepID=UPI0013154E2E|nr:cytochrome c [Elioraea rosea]